jgi:hypothetical protein
VTKLIAVFIIIVALFGGYHLFLYWERVKNEEETKKKQAVAAAVQGENLSGLPPGLEPSLKAAQQNSPAAFRKWLKTYDKALQDPRKAWIELDYCVAIAREDPSEARRVFAEVKKRTPPSSPVWPRVKSLEKTYK